MASGRLDNVFMNKIKTDSVNSQTFFNIMAMAIRGGISSLTMPIFTRMLGTEQYGMLSIYLSWSGILACIMGLQCGSSLATRYYKYDDYKEYKSGLFTFCLITCGVVFAISILCLDLIEGLIELPRIVIIMMLFDATTAFIVSYAGLGWIYEKKAQNNMIVTIVNSVIGTLLSIGLIYVWKTQELYVARIIGLLIPAVIVSIVIIIGIYRYGGINLKIEYIKYGLGFGTPIMVHRLSHYVLSQSDRVMMQKMNIDMSEIGVYSFAYSFASILTAILAALGNAWSPFMFDGLKRRKYDETNKSIKNYVQLFAILCCGFVLVSKEFGILFGGKQFSSGLMLVPIFVLAIYCTFIYEFAVSYETYMEKPRYIAIMTALAAIINIILNFVLIPLWGIWGASIATLLGYLFLAILHTIIVRVWKQDKYPLKNCHVYIGLIVLVFVSAFFYVFYELWIIRWIIALIFGIYLIISVVKRRRIF